MRFEDEYKNIRDDFERSLAGVVPDDIPERLKSSIKYSLLGGGKRLRPVLYLSVLGVYGKRPGVSDMKIACALECIHTYSLVHDDLPIMDNDDYRRGQPTNHKKFSEATALLAGDGLLNLAYELLADAALADVKYVEVMRIIALNSGVSGMVGGQAREFETALDTADASLLAEITALKTGKLIESAILSGCVSAGKKCDEAVWKKFAAIFGSAFQLCDDLLDSSSGEHSLVSLMGRNKAAAELGILESSAEALLDSIDGDVSFLKSMCAAFLLRCTDGL